MLIDLDSLTYSKHFPVSPHPFISEAFTELNSAKCEKVVRLVEEKEKPGMGLVAGIRNGVIHSPFSAPFGGFHFRKDIMYIGEVDSFVDSLKEYIESQGLSGIDITLPPYIYHLTFNEKLVNALIRSGLNFKLPDITNWVNLKQFQEKFSQKNSKEYLRQAVRNALSFHLVDEREEQVEIYDIISSNRARFGRPIYMTFKDIEDTGALWPVDFFKVTTADKQMVASAIFYRSHPEICFALFWGDTEQGRPLRAMDFLTFHLWTHYKRLGFQYIDLGISTEAGHPNEGLLRFKESHEATSSLKYTFSWSVS